MLRWLTLLVAFSCLTAGLWAQEPPMGEGPPPNARGVRGTVTAVNGSTVTIKTDEGETYKVETSVNTRIMKNREPAKIGDVHIGDMLVAGGEVDTKARTVGAVFAAIIDAEQVKQMRADLGKTWLAGSVTAIQDTNITVKRIDGAMQTFSVDENTSFKKRRESITLADIQPGDTISARGAIKNGTFVAETVNVGRGPMGPGMGPGMGERMGQGAGASGAPPKQQP